MAVSESNASAFGSPSVDLKEGIIPNNKDHAAGNKSPDSVALPPPARSSYSEIDRLLDLSTRFSGSAEDSGHSETEAYDELEPVPSADFIVDLSKLTPDEVRDLLRHTKESGEARRAQNARDLMVMRRKLSGLEDKLKRKLGVTSNMATYTQAMKTDMPLPTYVTSNQTQLCRAFHVHEVYMNQIKKMQKRNKKVISFLTKQKKLIQEESKRREAPLREKTDASRQEVVRMCRILEVNPDDWRKPEENELIQRISDVLTTGIPTMFTEWVTRTSSQGSI